MATPPPTKKPTKKPSEEAVLSRARRLMRAEKRKLWNLLGFEGDYDDAKFEEHVAGLAAQKESTMTDQEKNAARIKELETQVATLNGKLATSQESETKARQALQSAEKKFQRASVEAEIREAARAVGIMDPDYAIHLYREHLKKLPEAERDQKAPMPDQYFGEVLKKDPSKKHLFREEVVAAGPKSVAAEQTQTQPPPPAQTPANGTAPAAPKPGDATAKPPESVEKLSPRDFAKETERKYGFRPTIYG